MAFSNILIQNVLKREHNAIARTISTIENESPLAREILQEIYKYTGKAYRIGITGPPGAGKSTISSKLAKYYRQKSLWVGIIAVDPTSPFTGGALLGDRIRMTDVELDEGVFIRSMASRGSLGGLSRKTKEAAEVLDAAGFDIIILETVGVGQSELDIASAADTTIVVLVPESGDSIQAMKAGLMEIADFIVLNKADRAGAHQAAVSIKTVLNFRPKTDTWIPDVIECVASEGKGIDKIAELIDKHHQFSFSHNIFQEKRRTRLTGWIRELISEKLHVDFWNEEREKILQQKMNDLMDKKTTPYEVTESLLNNYNF